MKARKLKTYLANSVWLHRVEDKYRASNGCKQFTIVVRAPNQRRVAELIGGNTSLRHLRVYGGIHEASEAHSSIPTMDEVIFYHVEDTKHGYVGKWLAYMPNILSKLSAPAKK